MSFDAEVSQAMNTCLRKARKARVCIECARQIESGERYEYVSGVWDHQGQDFKTCVECAEVRKNLQNRINQEPGYDGYNIVFGCLQEQLRFWRREISLSCL